MLEDLGPEKSVLRKIGGDQPTQLHSRVPAETGGRKSHLDGSVTKFDIAATQINSYMRPRSTKPEAVKSNYLSSSSTYL